MRISLCLLVWNELEGCRFTVPQLPRHHFEEIYAVDVESTDGTAEYLASQGIPVYLQPKRGLNAAYVHAVEKSNCDAVVVFFPKGNVAPADEQVYKELNYLNGCHVTTFCGIGLTRYGYYQCEVAGSIDRVFGLDIGRKELPLSTDQMFDLFEVFCKYCGYFKHENARTDEEVLSPTWRQAYEVYQNKRPTLSLY